MTNLRRDALSSAKADLRKKAREILASYSREEFHARSQRVVARVHEVPVYRDATHIAMYIGVGREVQTDALLAEVLERRGCVFLPVWIEREKIYRFARHEAGRPMVPGPLGIPQPDSDDHADAQDLNLILVPGVAFSPQGARLGHGGGYYDRMLAAVRHDVRVLKVGLALQGQLFDTVPVGETDVRLDVVLTDENEYVANHPAKA